MQNTKFYFILSSEINAYQKQIKVISITSEMIWYQSLVIDISLILFDLILYVPSTIFVIKGRVFLGWTSTKLGLMFLLKDNAVTPVRLEPAALRSRVKHSTTESLRSLISAYIFTVAFFLDYLWLFHSLNAAHFESSNAYNFLICEQKHKVWGVIFIVRTWGTFWYQNNSDLLKFFDVEFSTPPASVSEAMHVPYATQRHQQIMTSLMMSLVLHFDAD